MFAAHLPNTSLVIPISYLVAGGGGGAAGQTTAGYTDNGAGGAGGYLAADGYYPESGVPITITVGLGGTGGAVNTNGTNGGDSSFGSIVSYGGGYGATVGNNGGNGGSGGGAGAGATPGTGVVGQGHDGGSSALDGGAGGGAGSAAASDAPGLGISNSIVELAGPYCAGGAHNGGYATPGSGGETVSGPTPESGFPGQSGIVIIAVPLAAPILTTTGSPTVSVIADRRVYQFTSNGTITFPAPN